MEVFKLTLEQMLMMALLISVGFILKKKNIVTDKASIAISKLETFVFIPALNLFNQLNKCTVETFTQNSKIMLYSLCMVLVAIGLSYPLSYLFVRKKENTPEEDYQRNVYKYSLTFANYGYVGNFIVQGIWGSDGLFKYLLFTFFLSCACYAWGLFILVPKDKNRSSVLKNLRKGLLTPPTIALLTGIIGGLLGVKQYIPGFVMTALSNASNCMGPCSMLLAGIVIGGYQFKGLITNKKVYFASLLRLIVIPAVFISILKLINTDPEIVKFALIAYCAPLGLNSIVYPAAYGGETKTGASMVMISTALSVITIPLMCMFFGII